MFRIKPAAETDSDGGDAALAGERLRYEPVNTREVAQVITVANVPEHLTYNDARMHQTSQLQPKQRKPHACSMVPLTAH